MNRRSFGFWTRVILASLCGCCVLQAESGRVYKLELTPIDKPLPILADHPQYVASVVETRRFSIPPLIEDANGNLSLRAWRYSYNARGILESEIRLDGKKTAIIVVHPWGIDDGQGRQTPEPAGVAFGCTPEKNKRMLEHARDVLNPLLSRLRGVVALVAYSLPGREDSIRKKLYRSIRSKPSESDRVAGAEELRTVLSAFSYRGGTLPQEISLSEERPVRDFFEVLPGLSAYEHYNPEGFWDLPVPVMRPIEMDPGDVVIYDGDGYAALRAFLKESGIRHVLLCGYHADMCVCSTTAGYENLREDFNVILVGDAVQASLPANEHAAHSTNHAVSTASLKVLVTQASWIVTRPPGAPSDAAVRTQPKPIAP